MRYHKGEFYHEHYDNKSDGPLTRAATILVYLCDTEEGGATRCAAVTVCCTHMGCLLWVLQARRLVACVPLAVDTYAEDFVSGGDNHVRG